MTNLLTWYSKKKHCSVQTSAVSSAWLYPTKDVYTGAGFWVHVMKRIKIFSGSAILMYENVTHLHCPGYLYNIKLPIWNSNQGKYKVFSLG